MLALAECIGGEQLDAGRAIRTSDGRLAPFSRGRVFDDVEDALLRGNDRGQFREDHLADGHEIALALEQAGELGEVGLEPILLGVLQRRVAQVADHLVERVLELRHLAARLDGDGTRKVAPGHGGRHVGDGAQLRGERCGELVDVVVEREPGSRRAGHVGLAAELSLRTHLACDGGHLIGKGGERVDHVVDRVGQGGDFTLGFHEELALEVAVGDRRDNRGHAAHLVGEVARHGVDVVGQVLPGARDPAHVGLSAELAFRAHLPGHARDLRSEGVELIDHRVDRVLQLQDLASARPP